jgi:adenylate cyclase
LGAQDRFPGGAVARVFLSYAREDADSAKRLAEVVGRAGHEVWWDRHLHGGSQFTNEIDKALKNAQAVVVLWTDSSVSSAWVQDEAAEGRDTGRLVPISLNGCRPPLGFRQFHTVELGRWNGDGDPEHIDELLEGIGKAAGTAATATSSGRPAEAPAPPAF